MHQKLSKSTHTTRRTVDFCLAVKKKVFLTTSENLREPSLRLHLYKTGKMILKNKISDYYFFLHRLEVRRKTRFWGPYCRPTSLNPSTRANLTIDPVHYSTFRKKTNKNKGNMNSWKFSNTHRNFCGRCSWVSFHKTACFLFW